MPPIRPTSPRAERRRAARGGRRGALDLAGLRARVAVASVPGPPEWADRARRVLVAWIDAVAARGAPLRDVVGAMASGAAARQVGDALRAEAMRVPPPAVRDADCAAGCAFCCILDGPDGGTITEVEARAVQAALAPHAGAPDGRCWHPRACPALDPATRACRSYDARPSLCRSYFSSDAGACRANAEGGAAAGAGLLGSHPDMLAVHALARTALAGVARVETFALAAVARAAVDGLGAEAALAAARHGPGAFDATLRGLGGGAAAAVSSSARRRSG